MSNVLDINTYNNSKNGNTSIIILSEHSQQQEQKQEKCLEMEALFSGLNNFFRDDDILKESEHSSELLGNLIFTAYLLVIAFGSIGNLLTIMAVLRNKQMASPTTVYTVLYVFWPFSRPLCKIAGSLQGFNIFLSTFSITAIALDRYVLVIFPTKKQRQQNLSLIFFSLIWLASILLAAPLFLAADISPIFHDSQCGIELNLCNEQNERWKELLISKEAYTVGVIILQYLLPLASIAFAYSRIARRMGTRKSFRCASGGRESRKNSVFLVCLLVNY
ncbi:unnamed protein product [Meloidogyne enterolobii]|uniref:Uncharacterized protein n=1 Tax=Meloidogyne enterolobii TaxID=390850 RepID=A0ACB0Z593_MELEN